MNVGCMGRGDGYTGFWWRNVRERGYLGKPGADGRIILKCIFKKWEFVSWTGLFWLGIGTGVGHL